MIDWTAMILAVLLTGLALFIKWVDKYLSDRDRKL